MIKKEDLVQRLERLSEHYLKEFQKYEGKGIRFKLENSDLWKPLELRAFFYNFLSILKAKFPSLTLRQLQELFKAIRSHYNRAFPPKMVLPKYESLLTLNEIKEGEKIQNFLNSVNKLKSVRLNGTLHELNIIHDEELLEHILNSIKEFYSDYRHSSSSNYIELLKNNKLKDFHFEKRNEFANNCYKTILELNIFDKEGEKILLTYWILYVFKYLDEEAHLTRSNEYQPNNSYKSYLRDILKN